MNEEEMKFIAERLKVVSVYHLEVEVIASALLAMKEHPNMSIGNAFEVGCGEWDV